MKLTNKASILFLAFSASLTLSIVFATENKDSAPQGEVPVPEDAGTDSESQPENVATEQTQEGSGEQPQQGATEQTPEGAAEQTPEGTEEPTPEGAAEQTPEGATEQTPEGSGENTHEGSGEQTHEGSGENTHEGSGEHTHEDSSEHTHEDSAEHTREGETGDGHHETGTGGESDNEENPTGEEEKTEEEEPTEDSGCRTPSCEIECKSQFGYKRCGCAAFKGGCCECTCEKWGKPFCRRVYKS